MSLLWALILTVLFEISLFLVVHTCLFLLLCFECNTLFTYQYCDIPDTTMMVYKNLAYDSYSFQHHLDKFPILFILKLSLLNISFWSHQDVQGQYWLDQWNVECQWYLVNRWEYCSHRLTYVFSICLYFHFLTWFVANHIPVLPVVN